MTTLQGMVNNIVDELGLPRPTTVVTSSDQTARTLLAHANKEGEDLVKFHDWTILTREHTLTTVIGQAEYALPTDYQRLLRQTEWDRTGRRPLVGPLDGPDWQNIKSSGLGSGIIGYRFRIYRASTGNTRKIYLDPVPTVNGESLVFEYISKNFCAAAGGTAQEQWAADTDVPILDARLMELGISVRYRRGRGLNFASEVDEYDQLLSTSVAQDRPSRVLNLSEHRSARLLNSSNIPDTGYGV